MTSATYALAAELTGLEAMLRAVTVEVSSGMGNRGSGVIWREDGLIVTNAHVARAKWLAVTLSDGRTSGASVVARSARLDLAVLRVPWSDLPRAQIGDAHRLRTGDLVFAYGAPLGIPRAMSLGIVHHAPIPGPTALIQMDLRLAPGNSGGPLCDATLGIVGITTAVVGGVGLAIPSHLVTRFVRRTLREPAAA